MTGADSTCRLLPHAVKAADLLRAGRLRRPVQSQILTCFVWRQQ